MIGHHQGATQIGGHAADAVVEHPPTAQHGQKQPEAVADAELGQGAPPLPAQTERQQGEPEEREQQAAHPEQGEAKGRADQPPAPVQRRCHAHS
ncbi:hypothetical protein D3C72_917540 [compost metagenome]